MSAPRAVVFACGSLGAPDLPRRGLSAGSAPLAVLLLDVEADLELRDGDRTVWSERAFPVAELARTLSSWLSLPDRERADFAFDSMAYDAPGAVRIAPEADGWRVGSVHAPGSWTTPMEWAALRAGLVEFVEAVRTGVAELGVDPDLVVPRCSRTG
ncbi:hypothetical protein ACGFX4_30600 [Kitasatospora sp. NPDC048365]|uniref:DUF7878 domain-containing protein n=1 Tax=Kitasatospora sp. NPDC048365 TaxID=3364050 RepID=UPI00371D27AF